MRILVVSPFHYHATGGVASAVKALAQEFTELGHDVTVLARGETAQLRFEETNSAGNVYSLHLPKVVWKDNVVRGLCAYAVRLPKALWELRRFLKDRDFDVLFVQYPIPRLGCFGVLRRLSRWKLVVTFQGNDAHDLAARHFLERQAVGWLVNSADKVTGVSASLLSKVRAVFPLAAASAIQIPNGAPDRRAPAIHGTAAGLSSTEPYLLTVGKLIHRKGIDVLISALAEARRAGADLRLLVVGDGSERSALQKLAEQCGVAAHVQFVGEQPHEVVLELMLGCHFFVLASRAEGLPLVIVEAMSCGKAVVATRIDGIPDVVVHGETGLLVDANDVGSLAIALIEMDGNETLRRSCELGAATLFQRGYSWRSIAELYLRLVETPDDRVPKHPTEFARSSGHVRVGG